MTIRFNKTPGQNPEKMIQKYSIFMEIVGVENNVRGLSMMTNTVFSLSVCQMGDKVTNKSLVSFESLIKILDSQWGEFC